jgi:hypothetical protein
VPPFEQLFYRFEPWHLPIIADAKSVCTRTENLISGGASAAQAKNKAFFMLCPSCRRPAPYEGACFHPLALPCDRNHAPGAAVAGIFFVTVCVARSITDTSLEGPFAEKSVFRPEKCDPPGALATFKGRLHLVRRRADDEHLVGSASKSRGVTVTERFTCTKP